MLLNIGTYVIDNYNIRQKIKYKVKEKNFTLKNARKKKPRGGVLGKPEV